MGRHRDAKVLAAWRVQLGSTFFLGAAGECGEAPRHEGSLEAEADEEGAGGALGRTPPPGFPPGWPTGSQRTLTMGTHGTSLCRVRSKAAPRARRAGGPDAAKAARPVHARKPIPNNELDLPTGGGFACVPRELAGQGAAAQLSHRGRLLVGGSLSCV